MDKIGQNINAAIDYLQYHETGKCTKKGGTLNTGSMDRQNMRQQACMILGVSVNATEQQIKAAYKSLVKQYHPDSGKVKNSEYYHKVVQAYQYLKANPVQIPVRGYGKVIGGQGAGAYGSFSYGRAGEYAQFERAYQRKKQERRAAFEERLKVEKERQEKYERAMDAIHAICAAEAIKTLIQESKKRGE